MNAFSDLVTSDMRLVILRTLAQDPDYSVNEYVLAGALKMLGHNVSRDRLLTEAAWLAEQGLITSTDVMGSLVIKLTRRGKDVADGAVVVPGVKRPEPEL
jgi:hypothetical protein